MDKLEKAMEKPDAGIEAAEGETSAPGGDEYWAGILRQKEDLQIQLNNLKDSSFCLNTIE